MNRRMAIGGGLIVGIVALYFYMHALPDSDVIARSNNGDGIAQWITLLVSILGFLTACVGLYKEILSARATKEK